MQEWRKKWKRNIDTECVTRAVCRSTLAYRERLSRRGRKRREGQTSFKMEKLLGFSPLPLHPPSFLCEYCNSFCVVRGHILVLWRLTSSSVRPRNVSALQLKCTMISRANAVNGITFRVILLKLQIRREGNVETSLFFLLFDWMCSVTCLSRKRQSCMC